MADGHPSLAGLVEAANLDTPLPVFQGAESDYVVPGRGIPIGVPKFLTSLWEIMHHPSFANVIGWSEAGDSLVVHDVPNLEADVLPRYFKHGRFNSFLKQLSMYSFKKLRGVERSWAHPFFRRGRPSDLAKVERRPVGKVVATAHYGSASGEAGYGDGDGDGEDFGYHVPAFSTTASSGSASKRRPAAAAGRNAHQTRGSKRRRRGDDDDEVIRASEVELEDEEDEEESGDGHEVPDAASALVHTAANAAAEHAADLDAAASRFTGRKRGAPSSAAASGGAHSASASASALAAEIASLRAQLASQAEESRAEAARASAAYVSAVSLSRFSDVLLHMTRCLLDAGGLEVDTAAADAGAPLCLRISRRASTQPQESASDEKGARARDALPAALQAAAAQFIGSEEVASGAGACANVRVDSSTGDVIVTVPIAAPPSAGSDVGAASGSSVTAALVAHLQPHFPAVLSSNGDENGNGSGDGGQTASSAAAAAAAVPEPASVSSATGSSTGAHRMLPGLQRQGRGLALTTSSSSSTLFPTDIPHAGAVSGGGEGSDSPAASAASGQPFLPAVAPKLLPGLMSYPQASFDSSSSGAAGGPGASPMPPPIELTGYGVISSQRDPAAPFSVRPGLLPPLHSLASLPLGHAAGFDSTASFPQFPLLATRGTSGFSGRGVSRDSTGSTEDAAAAARPSQAALSSVGLPLPSPSTSSEAALGAPSNSSGSGSGTGGAPATDPFARTQARLLPVSGPGLRHQHTFAGFVPFGSPMLAALASASGPPGTAGVPSLGANGGGGRQQLL